jgi:hypothetical protein
MSIKEYDEAADIAYLMKEGYELEQIKTIVGVRRRLFHLGKGARNPRPNTRAQDKHSQCPFINLVGMLRVTLR